MRAAGIRDLRRRISTTTRLWSAVSKNCRARRNAPSASSHWRGCLAQGDDIVPIPGTKRKERLLENIGALSVKLSAADLAQISDAIPIGAAAGLRYPEAQMKSVYI